MDDSENVAVDIGVQVRAIRRRRGMTAVTLAKSASISQPFLSQIERGVTAPSLTTLYSLANSLDVPLSRLLARAENTGTADRRAPVVRASEGIEQFARVLGSVDGDLQIEALEHEFLPEDGDREWFQHPGMDFLYVLEGAVELQRTGEPAEVLSAGSARIYSGEVAHRCVTYGDQPARALVVAVRQSVEPEVRYNSGTSPTASTKRG